MMVKMPIIVRMVVLLSMNNDDNRKAAKSSNRSDRSNHGLRNAEKAVVLLAIEFLLKAACHAEAEEHPLPST